MPLVIGQDGVFVLPETIRARFTQFSAQTDAQIEPYILESRLYVDGLWPQNARGLAQIFVVAHLMSLAGIGSTQIGPVSMPADQSIESFRIDDIAVSFSSPASVMRAQQSGSTSHWSSTSPGRQFEALRKRYFGGGYFLGG